MKRLDGYRRVIVDGQPCIWAYYMTDAEAEALMDMAGAR